MLTEGGKNHYQWERLWGKAHQHKAGDLGIFYTDFSNISDHLHVILNKKKSICLVRQNLYMLFFENYNLNSSSSTVGLRISHNRLSWVIFRQCNGNFLQLSTCLLLLFAVLGTEPRHKPHPWPLFLANPSLRTGQCGSGPLQKKACPPHPQCWLAFSDQSLDALS